MAVARRTGPGSAGAVRSTGTTPAIRVRGLRFAYPSGPDVLRGIDLEVSRGSSLVLMGPSGCGKSTLLKSMNGLLLPLRGTVEILGTPVSGTTAPEIRRRVGYIPQQLGLVRTGTVRHNVLIGGLHRMPVGRSLLGLIPPDERAFADRCIRVVGLEDKAESEVRRLSGGERQRVAIARALMQRPKVLLADEFVSDLDFVTAAGIMDVIREVRRTGVTTVVALHDLTFARGFAERVVVLKGGMTVLDSSSTAITADSLREFFAP